jgi:hypothetical protein
MQSTLLVRNLNKAGIIFLVSSPFLMIGYYLGDRGIRWFPHMAAILLLCLLASVICFFMATIIQAGNNALAVDKYLNHKRAVLWSLILLITFGFIFNLATRQDATPLTTMKPQEFDLQLNQNLELLTIYNNELDALLNRIQDRQDLINENPDKVLNANQEKFVRQCWLSFYDYAYAVDQIHDFYILYEKTYQIISLFKQNSNIVKFLNAPHPNSDIGTDSFSRVQTELFGLESNIRLQSARGYLKWLDVVLNAKDSDYSGICTSLWPRIERNLAVIDNIDLFEHSKEVIDADFEIIRQGVSRVWFPAQKGVAEWMGDSRIKRAGQYLITPQLQSEIVPKLAPGDVMLSRKNWYLSNVGLPGFWPHAVLYIGTPDELTSYFDTPEVNDYLKNIAGQETTFDQYMSQLYPLKWLKYKAGSGDSDYHVIEAIKYGVILNPLEKACGDYLVALRPRLDKVAKAQAIIEAFRHLDKSYDFDFDFATDHALVCTELVWRSYRPDTGKEGLNIQTIDVAGRQTLPANEIAKLYVAEANTDDAQFDFVFFIDASEEKVAAFLSDEETFQTTIDRSKWSFSQN